MWCDNFDLDLYKVLPEAHEILAPVKDVKLYTHGRKTHGTLNGPSCWNHYLGLVAFFGFIPTHIKPEAFWTDSGVVACTFEEAVRDCWCHTYAVVLSVFLPGRGPSSGSGHGSHCLTIWNNSAPEMRRDFEILMYHTRKWGQPREEEAFGARSRVLESLRQAVGRLVAVLELGPVLNENEGR